MTQTLVPQVLNYSELAAAWMVAKREEEEAKARRYAIEADLLGFLPELPEEGERSMRLNGYKLTGKNALNVTVKDADAFNVALLKGTLPASVIKTTIYDTGVKRLRREAQKQDATALAIYGALLPMLDIKPAKPSVTVVAYE